MVRDEIPVLLTAFLKETTVFSETLFHAWRDALSSLLWQFHFESCHLQGSVCLSSRSPFSLLCPITSRSAAHQLGNQESNILDDVKSQHLACNMWVGQLSMCDVAVSRVGALRIPIHPHIHGAKASYKGPEALHLGGILGQDLILSWLNISIWERVV